MLVCLGFISPLPACLIPVTLQFLTESTMVVDINWQVQPQARALMTLLEYKPPSSWDIFVLVRFMCSQLMSSIDTLLYRCVLLQRVFNNIHDCKFRNQRTLSCFN
ncbi:hypothetical protein ACFX13_005145 [Malus domestica]